MEGKIASKPSVPNPNSLLRSFALEGAFVILLGELPPELRLDGNGFEALWATHPEAFHQIVMGGRPTPTPRWQQAYGADYHYTGSVNRALPLTPAMGAWLAWAREAIDPQLNGLLLNWYDGAARHYIGKHRDSETNRIEGSAIVTLSFGQERVFRLRPVGGKGFVDVPAVDGGVIVIPWETNRAWTHEVTTSGGAEGRRISVTLRAFHPG